MVQTDPCELISDLAYAVDKPTAALRTQAQVEALNALCVYGLGNDVLFRDARRGGATLEICSAMQVYGHEKEVALGGMRALRLMNLAWKCTLPLPESNPELFDNLAVTVMDVTRDMMQLHSYDFCNPDIVLECIEICMIFRQVLRLDVLMFAYEVRAVAAAVHAQVSRFTCEPGSHTFSADVQAKELEMNMAVQVINAGALYMSMVTCDDAHAAGADSAALVAIDAISADALTSHALFISHRFYTILGHTSMARCMTEWLSPAWARPLGPEIIKTAAAEMKRRRWLRRTLPRLIESNLGGGNALAELLAETLHVEETGDGWGVNFDKRPYVSLFYGGFGPVFYAYRTDPHVVHVVD